MYSCTISRFGPGILHHYQCVINTNPATKLIFGEKSQANNFKKRFDEMERALEAGEVSAEEGADWLIAEGKLAKFLYRAYAGDIEKLQLNQTVSKPVMKMLPAEKAEALEIRSFLQTQKRLAEHFVDEGFRRQLEGF